MGDALFNRRGALELSSSFVSKKRKRLGKLLLCTFFGPIWKEEISELLRIVNVHIFFFDR